MSNDWFRESNIVSVVCRFLIEHGWSIDKVTETVMGDQGPDILAIRDHATLIVKVKSFPSTIKAGDANAGQPKTIVSAARARRWYSQMLLAATMAQNEYQDAIIGIALPSFATYSQLIRQTQQAFSKLGLVLVVVNSEGVVEMLTDA